MGYEDDLNLYAYTRNDPLNRWDPTGAYTCGEERTACPESIQQGVSDVATAAANSQDTATQNSLNEVAGFLGENGVETGVNFILGGAERGTLGQTNTDSEGNSTIGLAGSLTPDDPALARHERVDLASTIAHETRHAIQGRESGGNPTSVGQERANERQAWTDQLGTIRGLAGVTPGPMISTPPPGDAAADSRWVDQNAERSVTDWCRRGGQC